jgi:hypothetical protein
MKLVVNSLFSIADLFIIRGLPLMLCIGPDPFEYRMLYLFQFTNASKDVS